MPEQQREKDLIDKISEFFINPNKDIAYSIRKRGDDEIEIRDSIFDGYARGFIRFVLVGMAFIGILDTGVPFYREYQNAKQNYESVFESDKFLQPMYKEHVEFMNNPEMIKKYNLSPYKETYEEFKESYFKEYQKYYKYAPLYLCFYCIFFIGALFAFFLPRPRGFRVNRKKRVIYWQTIFGSHAIAFVPEQGDPLAGINACMRLVGMSVFHCNFGLTTTFPNVASLPCSAYIQAQARNITPKSYALFVPILRKIIRNF